MHKVDLTEFIYLDLGYFFHYVLYQVMICLLSLERVAPLHLIQPFSLDTPQKIILCNSSFKPISEN